MGQPITLSLALADEAATIELGTQLARQLPASTDSWLVSLQGELGAGKSTLARGIIRALGHDGPVPSPTYTLVEPYELAGRRVYHADLYRIGSADELEFLGWDELGDGLLLVEWPERVPLLLEQADVRVVLAYAGASRTATLTAATRRGAAWLASLNFAATLSTATVP